MLLRSQMHPVHSVAMCIPDCMQARLCKLYFPPLIINIVELIGILLISVGKQGVDLSLPLSGSKRGLYNVLCTYRFTAMWQAASNLYHAEMGQNPYHKRL